MLDEVWVHTRLDSPLFGALVHAVELAGPMLRADAAAGRIFDGPSDAPCSYVSAQGLTPPPGAEVTLHDWPTCEDSVFTLIRQSDASDGVFRPRELVDELTFSRKPLFRPVENLKPVVDSVGLSFHIMNGCWGAIVLMRCNDSSPFDDQCLDLVERMKPAFTRTLQRGYHQQLAGRPHPQAALHHLEMPSLADLLAKLSRTERQVLNYLRSELTEREVAEQLHRSPHTIHVHVKNIYRKLAVSSRKELLSLFRSV